jgi:Tol biopolymer transport system component
MTVSRRAFVAATVERRLLTQGHKGEGCKTHPHASFTPDGKGIVFSSSRFGTEDIFLVDIPEWKSLPTV